MHQEPEVSTAVTVKLDEVIAAAERAEVLGRKSHPRMLQRARGEQRRQHGVG